MSIDYSSLIGGYFIVRTTNAGVFAGVLTQYDPETRTAILDNSRRVWSWKGAATLSELSTEGPLYPRECRMPCAVQNHTVMGVEEFLPMSIKARERIDMVPVWTASE